MYVYMYFSNLLINFNLLPLVVWVHVTSMVPVRLCVPMP